MFSRFFIQRPVFAAVISIVIVLAGTVTMTQLPVELYPDISPPTVTVTTTYPGANAQVLQETVATPIELQVNGVENLLYMSSNCAADGSYGLTVTFEVGTDLDMASVLVQNRVNIALGVTTQKKSTNFVQAISLSSPDGTYDSLFLANYATLHIHDVLARVPGAGSVAVFGADNYGMRLWLDPDKLKARDLTVEDVIAAVQE